MGKITKDEYKRHFQFSWLAPLAITVIEKSNLMIRFAKHIIKIQLHIALLYGEQHAHRYTLMFIAQMLAAIWLCSVFIIILFIANGGDMMVLFAGAVIVVFIPFVMLKGVERQIEKRKREIILELPLFINKITLLINAGETVHQAFVRAIEQRDFSESHYLYQELRVVLKQLHNNYAFQQAMEELSRRCGVQEVSIFTNTILLNYRRGGSELVAALRGLAHQLWGTRKMVAKTVGEEASAKLVFPLIIIFIVVMVIVGAPAVLMMQG